MIFLEVEPSTGKSSTVQSDKPKYLKRYSKCHLSQNAIITLLTYFAACNLDDAKNNDLSTFASEAQLSVLKLRRFI